jgi:hypothetical protein
MLTFRGKIDFHCLKAILVTECCNITQNCASVKKCILSHDAGSGCSRSSLFFLLLRQEIWFQTGLVTILKTLHLCYVIGI